jgi:hypothetical protein
MNAGRQTVPLDTRQLANGVYSLRLETGAATRSMRLVISHKRPNSQNSRLQQDDRIQRFLPLDPGDSVGYA